MANIEKQLKVVWKTLGKRDLVAGILINKKGVEIISVSNRAVTLIDTNRLNKEDLEDPEELSDSEIEEYMTKEAKNRDKSVKYIG